MSWSRSRVARPAEERQKEAARFCSQVWKSQHGLPSQRIKGPGIGKLEKIVFLKSLSVLIFHRKFMNEDRCELQA